MSPQKFIHFCHALSTKILVKNGKKCDFLNYLSCFWGVMHIKRHPHPQTFCGIVVHDRTDVPQKTYSLSSRFEHKNFGLKGQKMQFFEFLKLFLG